MTLALSRVSDFNHLMLKTLILFLSGSILLSCTKTSSSGGQSDGIQSLGALPKVTAAVKASSGSSFRAATSGLKFSEVSTQAWTGKSRTMCFTGDVIRNIMAEAGGPDLALCKLGVLETNSLLTPTYDGTSQYFSVAGLDGAGTTRLFKFDATKTGSSITDFHMFSCKNSSAQDSYLTATFSPDPTGSSSGLFVSMRSLSHYSSGGTTGKQMATTSGMTDSDGDWSEKMITYQGISSTTTWSRTSSMSITQASDSLTVYGSFTGAAGGTNETNCFWAKTQLLNMETLVTAALGDGFMKHQLNVGGTTCSGSTTNAAWTGDDRAVVADPTTSTYYTASQDIMALVPALASVPDANVSFTSQETWDCTASAPTTIDLTSPTTAVSAALAACEEKYSLSRAGSNCQSGS
ncbi:MAG: hypothetical protein HYZ71_12220 [Deltaproteobacteria bacterium]|nr:hypothetical protein [Deltaproteobacteria bacterium]